MMNPHKLTFRDVLVLIGGFIIIVYVFNMMSGSKTTTETTTGESIQQAAPPNYLAAVPGTRWRLNYGKDASMGPIFYDENALVEFLNAMNIRDNYALRDLADQQRVFVVRNSTKILIIEVGRVYSRGMAGLKVRVLEGKSAGKAGWVPSFELQSLSEGIE